MAKSIYVLNGPNLNLLGQRQPDIYGHNTLADIDVLCRRRAQQYGLDVTFRQSNHEGDVVDWLQEARQEAAGVIINPGAFTHTSIAILDAIIATELPVIEVHISNIHAREEFRRHSYVSTVAKAVLCGFGIEGYGLAIDGLAALLGVKAQAA
jgi:3-dehydroquinate dehydratase II